MPTCDTDDASVSTNAGVVLAVWIRSNHRDARSIHAEVFRPATAPLGGRRRGEAAAPTEPEFASESSDEVEVDEVLDGRRGFSRKAWDESARVTAGVKHQEILREILR